MSVLILRPQQKIQQSSHAFTAAGVDNVAVGLMEISPIASSTKQLVEFSAQQNDWLVIFISTSAAELAINCQSDLTRATILAVGESTAAVLRSYDLKVQTPNEHNSEGLLALPQLNNINDKVIAIVKGVGGRTLLHEELTERGALVVDFSIYQRTVVTSPHATREWKTDEIQCIIATSGEMIRAAFDYWQNEWLKHVPWIVVSERTRAIAAKLGIKQIKLSAGASDGQLIHSAQDLLER